jgi:hypothetical protein
VLVIAVLVIIGGARAVLPAFDIGNAIQRMEADLTVGDRGAVSVTLSGGEPRTADADIPLYPGDSIAADRGSRATVTLFDGTVVRMDRGAAVTIEESALGTKRSTIALTLVRGTAWVMTPSARTFSGSIMRTIATPRMAASVPSGTEAMMTVDSVDVFSADGIGVELVLSDAPQGVIIGEGQSFTAPPKGTLGSDPYIHRSALPASAALVPFLVESRSQSATAVMFAQATSAPSEAILTVESPGEGIVLTTATVTVSGRYGTTTQRVRVNGYQASLTPDGRRYSIEIALPEGDTVPITVEALDGAGTVTARVVRTVQRDRKPALKPTITSPAKDGQTYRTAHTELEIRGGAPQGTAGIIVNDYRLQLFSLGDTEWSYLASMRLGNYAPGENVFRVTSVGETGLRSEPAILTIILGEGEEGVVSTRVAPSSATPAPEQPDPSTLPNNDPLQPGMLKVTAPTIGTGHAAVLEGSGVELLIEGTVPQGTSSVWVNDYKLRLFTPGKAFFNYIAGTALGTLARGRNVYTIVARDAENRVLDRLEYVITLSR